MEYKIVLILLLLGVAIFSGCVDNADKTEYYLEEFNETITLYDDNTVTISGHKEYGLSGTYRIDGENVIMIFPPFGSTLILKREKDRLINEKDGTTWVRK